MVGALSLTCTSRPAAGGDQLNLPFAISFAQRSSFIQLVDENTRFVVAVQRRGEGLKMLRCIEGSGAAGFAHDAARRGFVVLYRAGEPNHCPACGRTHWYVGRLSAECGFCGTAIALADTGMTGTGLMHRPRYEEAA